MQADKITNRILQDANLKANSILEEAENQAKSITDKATEFSKNKKAEALKKVENFMSSVQEKYQTLLKIEGNKIILKTKQNVLDDLKIKATDFLVNLPKENKLKFLEKLIKKYAEREETVFYNIKGLVETDLTKLKPVKDLKLQVKKLNLEEQGIIISNNNCDKNLLFSTLVSNAFEEKEGELNKILF